MRYTPTQGRIVIGIGKNCSVAYQIRRLGLRQASYPLDWLGTPDAALTASLIHSGFSTFMNRENLDVIGVSDNGLYYQVMDQQWKCSSHHDYPVVEGEPALYNYGHVQQLLQNRISRFLHDIRSDKPLTIIRLGYRQEDISMLAEAIRSYRKSPFELILIEESHADQQPKVIAETDNTIQYRIPAGNTWYGNDEAWNLLAVDVLHVHVN